VIWREEGGIGLLIHFLVDGCIVQLIVDALEASGSVWLRTLGFGEVL
jgi:hypothetical protein